MIDLPIEQAIYSNVEAGGYRFLARSPGFLDDWLPEAERLCAGFGERPAGIACPAAVFAQPLGPKHVAIVQVADQGTDDAQRPGALGFRLLVLPRRDYENWLGDPFAVADRFPPVWSERGTLPTLHWPLEPLPPRTVAQVQDVLKNGDSPTLLGSVQALIDAGKVAFEKSAPAPGLVRDLWMLLPYSTRSQLWPASFAFSNALGFDAVVLPRIDPEQCAGYLTGDQAGDYPEGRYEYYLQVAAESGNQHDLDALFARRSSRQTIKLALWIMAAMVPLALLMNFLNPPAAPVVPSTSRATTSKAAPAQATVPASLPHLAERYPPLTAEMQHRLVAALRELADHADLGPLPDPATAEELLDVIQLRLVPAGATDAVTQRWQQAGSSSQPERRLRALLYAFDVAGYDDPRLNPVELVDLLAAHLEKSRER